MQRIKKGGGESTQSISSIGTAMVLAAGFGKRLQPFTDRLPKPLVSVNSKPLIDYVLDHLEEGGVSKVVVNLHYLGDKIQKYLSKRVNLNIIFSWEKEKPLETGGGVKAALLEFGEDPFWVINSDSIWMNGPINMMLRMTSIWDPAKMDALLLIQSTETAHGYAGSGDFHVESDGRVKQKKPNEVVPWVFTGVQILHPKFFKNAPEGKFSLNLLYDRSIKAQRLYGVVHDGEWFHIGTPGNLAEAERYLNVIHSRKKK